MAINHKKLGVILFTSLIIASGCSSNNVSNSSKETNDSFQESKSEEAILLDKLRKEYEDVPRPVSVLEAIDENIEKVKDKNLKKEYIKLANDAFEKSLEFKNDYNGYELAKDYETLKKLNDLYSKYLSNDLKQRVNDFLEASLPPSVIFQRLIEGINEKITQKGYTVESLQDYMGIKIGDMRPDALDTVRKNGLQEKFLCPNQPCSFLSVSNRVIVFDDWTVSNIILIKDKSGKIINPFDVEYLVEKAKEQSNFARKKEEEETDFYERALKEKQNELQNGVRIGMTKEEVLNSSCGQPKDINKTTTAYGTREQWVYDNYNYLYFEDGVLTTIQN